jgi:pimeloyl-ACP methyl ester carboxylesterase
LAGYYPLQFLKHWCPCMHGKIRRRITDISKAPKSWRKDFHTHVGETLDIENQWVAELELMYGNNPHSFEALWRSFMEFPMSNISKDIRKVAELYHLPILLIWGTKDRILHIDGLNRWRQIIERTRRKQLKVNDKTVANADQIGPDINRFGEDKYGLVVKVFDNAAHGVLYEFHREVNADVVQFLKSNIR